MLRTSSNISLILNVYKASMITNSTQNIRYWATTMNMDGSHTIPPDISTHIAKKLQEAKNNKIGPPHQLLTKIRNSMIQKCISKCWCFQHLQTYTKLSRWLATSHHASQSKLTSWSQVNALTRFHKTKLKNPMSEISSLELQWTSTSQTWKRSRLVIERQNS